MKAKTTLRHFPILALFIMSFLSFASCSDKDSPIPEQTDNQDTNVPEDPMVKEYQEKIAGSLWVATNFKAVDSEGNYTDHGGVYGGIPIPKFLYTGQDCILEFFYGESQNHSIWLSGTIDPETGLLGANLPPYDDIYFEAIDDDILIVRTNCREGHDTYGKVFYKRLPGGFTSELLSLFRPSNFSPEELNLPPLDDRITKELFEAIADGYVWRSRGEAQWLDEEGNTVASGAKFGVQRHGLLYIGKGFYLYPYNNKSYIVKGSFDEATHAIAPMPEGETHNTIYIDRLAADKIYVHSGKGLYKENGVVRNDVSYHYDYILYPMSLEEFINMYPPANYTLHDLGL